MKSKIDSSLIEPALILLKAWAHHVVERKAYTRYQVQTEAGPASVTFGLFGKVFLFYLPNREEFEKGKWDSPTVRPMALEEAMKKHINGCVGAFDPNGVQAVQHESDSNDISDGTAKAIYLILQDLLELNFKKTNKDESFVPTQAKRSKSAETPRKYDQTQLNVTNMIGRAIHRDYLAHCMRWSYTKKIMKKGAKVLDLGCGRGAPLLQVLRSGIGGGNLPSLYVGVDLNKLKDVGNAHFQAKFYQVNFVEQPDLVPDDEWDFICSFESIEHMPKPEGLIFLDNIQKRMKDQTRFLISTPCFNGQAAKNHIYEWKREELREELEKRFVIDKCFGTFASKNEILKNMTERHQQVYNELLQYYEGDVMSVIMAPLYPEFSRNCIWECTKKP